MTNQKFRRMWCIPILLITLLAFLGTPAIAQSPDTSSLIVAVVDQNAAAVANAKIEVTNTATGAVREAVSSSEGQAAFSALSITGTYKVNVTQAGFEAKELSDITLRAGETATIKVTLAIGAQQVDVTVYGTAEGVRSDPQVGKRLDAIQIDETPILGRKASTLPLLNSAFRQAKGTGDLFVNTTYFVTGVGGRRSITTALDGANNDEGSARQVGTITTPLSAIQEITVLSNAFSSEYGWTSGAALNIVTKSGTNGVHGEGLFVIRPGGDFQARTFSNKGFCPDSTPSCVTPSALQHINPADIPDKLYQYSGSIGGPIVADKTFYFVSAENTRQDRTVYLSSTLPAFALPADGHLDYTGNYRQFLLNARVDHKFTPNQNLMFRFNVDRFFDNNPQDAVGGTNAPSVARRFSRRSTAYQANYTSVITPSLLNEARFAFLNGDPVNHWEAGTLSTAYTRAGSMPFTFGQSRLSDIYSKQWQISDTLSWTKGRNYFRFGGSITRHYSGGTGSEPGTAVLGTFTFNANTTAAFDQLTLANVQNYTQPVSYGVTSYKLKQWMNSIFVQDRIQVTRDLTLDLGLRYDRQTLTDAKNNFQPRVGFAWHPGGDARTAIRGGYGLYYTQIRANSFGTTLLSGPDGLTTYTATPGQVGFPTCLVGSCLPVNVDPRTLPVSQRPARDVTIRAGRRDFYRQQFATYGANFDLLPNYPDKLVNPRSQIFSLGAEREIVKGLFFGADYVHQHLNNIDRSIDLNAPAPFDRTAPGQYRCPVGVTGTCTQAQAITAANATRPIVPVAGGFRNINVLMNLGEADYNGLQTQFSYRGSRRFYASVGYTLSKATNTTEPDGNGIAANQGNIARLGEEERGPSVVDQRHRAVISFSYNLPYNFTFGTLSQFASARAFNATTGVDNNGDGATNDRPVINGVVVRKSPFRGTPTSEVALFGEHRIKFTEGTSLQLRVEVFNIFNHGNYLGRGQTIYGDGTTPSATFGQLVGTAVDSKLTNALPAFANVDPPRMIQFQARFRF